MNVSPTDSTTVSIEVARAVRAQRVEAEQAYKSSNATSASNPRRDSVEISAEARQLLRFEGAAARAAGREELVSRLKAEVQAGTYRADPQAIAQAMGKRSEQ